MGRGDQIYIHCGASTYTHHGIDCGDGTVIHNSKMTGVISRTSIADFASGKQVFVKAYGKCDSPDIVIKRAESKLNTLGYHVVDNNCEHFVFWCKTGENSKSHQVETVKGVGFTGLNVAGAGAVKMALKAGGRAGMGIAGAGGMAAAIGAGIAIEQLLADDESMPHHEREAREVGRIVGNTTLTVGSIAGAIGAFVVGGSTAAAAAALAPGLGAVVLGCGTYHLLKTNLGQALPGATSEKTTEDESQACLESQGMDVEKLRQLLLAMLEELCWLKWG